MNAQAEARWRRADWLALALLLTLGIVVRLASAGYPRVVWGDEPFYLWIGQSLWAGTGFDAFGYSAAHFPPLFPVLAGGLALLTGSLLERQQRHLRRQRCTVGCAALRPGPGHLQPNRGLDDRVDRSRSYPALTTGVLAWGTMTEPLYLLWVGVAIYALFLALDQQPMRWRDFALLGVALGLAYLTRTEALVFLVGSLHPAAGGPAAAPRPAGRRS